MPFRIRIRGPSGQSTATFEDDATIEILREQISKSTGLTEFDVKFGYPLTPLSLASYDKSQLLSNLDVKLNNEQLLVSRADSSTKTTSNDDAVQNAAKQATQAASKVVNKQESAPLSLTRKSNKDMDPPEIWVPDVGGHIVLRIMPDDNSCLFRAISSAVMSDIDGVHEMRSIVAERIQEDPITFNKAVLDNQDPDKYCRWIKSQDSWGGQVELLILSQYFGVEIFSIDVQTLRVDKYNEGAEKRCFVVYSGVHYDTIALTLPGSPPEEDIKQFYAPISDEILPKAKDLCKKLQEAHYYTDTAGFKVKCNICGASCVGERGATEHAEMTGHMNFGEADD